ncbi:MAG TPA: PKD domain-containing protein [Candidatus Bipolaricaulis anaerobius]|nr:PKD domain-containing protein [Candidatus Bipolaricaulis anaerobius]HNS24162.1 PKD domain-containing protein [Candidatus Bipolaricaulis anaerobius]
MVRKTSLWFLVSLMVAVPLSAQGYFQVTQGAVKAAIPPLAGAKAADEFYAYDGGLSRSGNELAETGNLVLFLYREPTTQDLYLFFIVNKADTGAGGNVRLTLTDLPIGADFVVKDDEGFPLFAIFLPELNDEYVLANGEYQILWTWGANSTDGGVFGPLGEEFRITLTPGAFSGVQRIVVKSGNINAPTRLELNTTEPIVIQGMTNQPPVANLVLSPAAPRARQQVTFDASGSVDPDGSIVRYRWDFNGDGVVDLESTEPTVKYAYLTGGSYTIRLTLVDNTGMETTYSMPVFVSLVTVTAVRSISTTTALPGYAFRVQVRIHTDQDLAGAGLDENPPVGWEITPVANGGAIFKRAEVQWVFLEPIKAGTERVIIYDVTVPEVELLASIRLPQQFCITGIFQAKVPDFEFEVAGESCFLVNDCLSVLEAVAHLVPAAMPGEEDRVDLRLSEAITADQLARATELWRTDRPVVKACGERISLHMLKLIAAYSLSCTAIDQPLPTMAPANLQAQRWIITPIPCEGVVIGFYDSAGNVVGNRFTVKVEITTDRDVYGVGLDEDLPIGWRVTPIQNDGFTYKPGVDQWAFTGTLKAGQTKTIIYQVEVPPTVTVETTPPDPCKVLSSETVVGRADSGHPCLEVEVTGASRVDLTDCLNVIVAISRWDVVRDTIDLSLSDKITFPQVQRAIAFWLEGTKVPRTCAPGIVDYETMKTIIALWLTGTPICEVLPGRAPGVCDR